MKVKATHYIKTNECSLRRLISLVERLVCLHVRPQQLHRSLIPENRVQILQKGADVDCWQKIFIELTTDTDFEVIEFSLLTCKWLENW